MDLTTESDLGLVQDLLNDRTREIDRLKSELVSKDELVQAITSRLEETVEQLDRLQRQGNSRPGPGGSGGAGSIKDVLDSQNALSERVDQSLNCWESAGAYFEQILQKLEDLASQPARPGSGPVAGPTIDSGPAGSAYERMKANLLANVPAMPAMSPPPLPMGALGADRASGDAEDFGATPVPIDVETASREELADGITLRDQYISHLIQSFRTRDDAILQKVDWSRLQSAPEDLRPQLLALGQRLREKIQREELDHSMERARLAREQARIELVKQQLEAQIRRLSSPAPATPPADEKKGKDSWLNRLKK
jgi:hypothetical protein